jgi:hypothetical protein
MSPIRGFGLMLLAFTLAGCATRSACAPGPYLEARAAPPLNVPEGMDAPDRRAALRVPEPRAGARAADGCVIEPPPFYAEPGEPNPDGLPVRPSALAAVGGTPAAISGPTRVTREITSFLSDWADAWNRRDAGGWLQYYRPDYVPAGYASPEEWRADQRERFQQPAVTAIDANTVAVEPQPDGNARVRFTQRFGEAPARRSVVKEMVLAPETRGGLRWQIIDESIAEVLPDAD